ncbi:MAG TPA: hypothetical protein VKG86_06220 [Terracidiphilus sp.]|nr:hypothetical protein [Terracidiphilus sp.]
MLLLASTVIETIGDESEAINVLPLLDVASSSSNSFEDVQQALFVAMKILPEESAAIAEEVYHQLIAPRFPILIVYAPPAFRAQLTIGMRS